MKKKLIKSQKRRNEMQKATEAVKNLMDAFMPKFKTVSVVNMKPEWICKGKYRKRKCPSINGQI